MAPNENEQPHTLAIGKHVVFRFWLIDIIFKSLRFYAKRSSAIHSHLENTLVGELFVEQVL